MKNKFYFSGISSLQNTEHSQMGTMALSVCMLGLLSSSPLARSKTWHSMCALFSVVVGSRTVDVEGDATHLALHACVLSALAALALLPQQHQMMAADFFAVENKSTKWVRPFSGAQPLGQQTLDDEPHELKLVKWQFTP